MKQLGAEAGGQRSLPSWASRLASTSAVAALALIAAPGAKADVAKRSICPAISSPSVGPLVPFSGTIDLDFTNDFTSYTASGYITIMCPGTTSVFDQALSLTVSPSLGTIDASNSAGDTLALWFAAPQSGTWAGFNAGDVSFGDVIFGDATRSPVRRYRQRYARPFRPGDTRPAAANNRSAAAPNRPARPAHPCRSRTLDLGDATARPRGPRSRGEAPAGVGLPGRKSLSAARFGAASGPERAPPRDLTTSSAFRYSLRAHSAAAPAGRRFYFGRPQADLGRPVSRDITRS